MTKHNSEDIRRCPRSLSKEEAFKVFQNNKEYDPLYSHDRLIKLAEWMDDIVENYHLLVHAVQGDMALRWNEQESAIEFVITEQGRDKTAENLEQDLQKKELTDEEKVQIQIDAAVELERVISSINFNDLDQTKSTDSIDPPPPGKYKPKDSG